MRYEQLYPLMRNASLAAFILLLAGCMTVPETGRKQMVLISPGEEMQMGLESFQQLKQEVPISQNREAAAMLDRVGKDIAAVADADLPNAQWEFVLFESEMANAFCLPGGKVGVYTGILPITKDENGLATVLGHEVAHAVARHGAAKVSEHVLMQAGAGLLGWATSESKEAYQKTAQVAYGLGSQVLVALPYSRAKESEADYMGLLYMARAGYDPKHAVDFWERFAEYGKAQGGNPPWFLSTHPLSDERIRQIQEWLPEAQLEYRPRP